VLRPLIIGIAVLSLVGPGSAQALLDPRRVERTGIAIPQCSGNAGLGSLSLRDQTMVSQVTRIIMLLAKIVAQPQIGQVGPGSCTDQNTWGVLP
jgi:hypothetical protein